MARCLEAGNVCHPITTRAIPERQMKETLYTRHRNTRVNDVKNDRKAALHTAVVKAVLCRERNVVLDGRPPPISNSEKELTRKECSTLAQLRSGLLGPYRSRIKKGCKSRMSSISFVCPAHPTTLIPLDYGADQRTLSGNSAIWRRDTHIEMNMD